MMNVMRGAFTNYPFAFTITAVTTGTGVISNLFSFVPQTAQKPIIEGLELGCEKFYNNTAPVLEKGANVLTDKVLIPITEKAVEVSFKLTKKFIKDIAHETYQTLPSPQEVAKTMQIGIKQLADDAYQALPSPQEVGKTMQIGIKKLADDTYSALPSQQEVKEVIWSAPPANTKGPVELLLEKVQTNIMPTVSQMHSTRTLVVTTAIVAGGTLAYLGYRKRHALMETCSKISQKFWKLPAA